MGMIVEEAGHPDGCPPGTAIPPKTRYGRGEGTTYVDGDALVIAHLGGLDLRSAARQRRTAGAAKECSDCGWLVW